MHAIGTPAAFAFHKAYFIISSWSELSDLSAAVSSNAASVSQDDSLSTSRGAKERISPENIPLLHFHSHHCKDLLTRRTVISTRRSRHEQFRHDFRVLLTTRMTLRDVHRQRGCAVSMGRRVRNCRLTAGNVSALNSAVLAVQLVLVQHVTK